MILANGTHKSKSNAHADENAAARKELAKVVSLSNRMVTGDHLAHNKFMVLADAAGVAQKIWTGSTNWTLSGLCTQANNGILFDDPTIAKLFLDQWNRLKAAGDAFPPTLIDSNTQLKTAKLGNRPVTVWFAQCAKGSISRAPALIQGAKQGVLFLVFDPGPKGTLLNDILALDSNKLYIHGVVNQDPGGKKQPLVKLVHRGHVVTPPNDVVLPAAIDDRLKFWIPEMKSYSIVMVHSKLIVVNPFGDHPVVITGSHNLGPKASSENDDNLVIVENDSVLAAQYAVNVMTVYNQYRWRYFRAVSKPPDKWDGLASADTWQNDYFQGEKLRELEFWLGTAGAATAQPKAARKPAAKPRTAPSAERAFRLIQFTLRARLRPTEGSRKMNPQGDDQVDVDLVVSQDKSGVHVMQHVAVPHPQPAQPPPAAHPAYTAPTAAQEAILTRHRAWLRATPEQRLGEVRGVLSGDWRRCDLGGRDLRSIEAHKAKLSGSNLANAPAR